MFLFLVNDTAIFPVTQGWHLHTMPTLIIVKYNFDYFTPFKYILWQFFSLESKLPQPLFLTFFPLLPACAICCCQSLSVGGPWAPVSAPGATHGEWHLTASSPFIPTAPDRKFLWSCYYSRAYPPCLGFLVLN